MGREWSWRQWEGLQRSCRGEDDSCSLSHLSCHSLLWLSAQGLYCESPGSLLRLSIIRSLHDSPYVSLPWAFCCGPSIMALCLDPHAFSVSGAI